MRRLAISALAAVAMTAPASAGKMNLSPTMTRTLTAAIQSRDFNCPVVKLAWSKGEDARGTVIKAFCGPEDRDGLFEHATFRVTLTPADRIIVAPWED